MGALALSSEEAEQLGRLLARAAEPMRHPGVEFSRLASSQQEILTAEDEPELAVEYIQPFIALVRLQVGGRAAWRDDQLVGLNAAGPPRERYQCHAVPVHRAQVHPRIAGRRAADQLVELHAVRARQWQQQFQGWPPPAAFQPRQRAHRNPGHLGECGQAGLALAAHRPQPRAYPCQHRAEIIVHAASLPFRQLRLPIQPGFGIVVAVAADGR